MFRHEAKDPEAYRLRLGAFIADVSPAMTFAPFLHQRGTFIIPTGSDAPIPKSTRGITFGASTCIAGISIFDGQPYIFHYDQPMSHRPLRLITGAEVGLIGGHTTLFFGQEEQTKLQKFVYLGHGTLSLMAHHDSRHHLTIRYMISP